jgi:transposase/sulfur carrier protein ThiS
VINNRILHKGVSPKQRHMRERGEHAVKLMRAASNKVAGTVAPQLGCSTSTVSRDLRKANWKAYTRPRAALLHNGDIVRRAQFATSALNSGWGDWVVADEKLFSLVLRGKFWEWVDTAKPETRRPLSTPNNSESLHVWGAVGPRGYKRLIFFPLLNDMKRTPRHGRHYVPRSKRKPGERRGRKPKPFAQLKRAAKARRGVDSEIYIDTILAPQAAALSGKRLVQDNASIRTSMETTSWLARHNVTVLELPQRSPDLSPQENVWGYLQNSVNARQPRTVAELKCYILEAFHKLNPRPFWNSIGRRLQECKRLKGGHLTGEWRKATAEAA